MGDATTTDAVEVQEPTLNDLKAKVAAVRGWIDFHRSTPMHYRREWEQALWALEDRIGLRYVGEHWKRWRGEELAIVRKGACEACGRTWDDVGKDGIVGGLRDPKDPWLCWECYTGARHRWLTLQRWWPTALLSRQMAGLAWCGSSLGFYKRSSDPLTAVNLRHHLIVMASHYWFEFFMAANGLLDRTIPPMRWFA